MSLVVLSAENKSVPLAMRKEIRDHTGGVAAELAKVEKATGVSGWTFDFEGDLAAFNDQLDNSYKGRLGEIIAGAYLPQVVRCIETNCKDEMIKEAFVEAATKKAIRFVPDMEKKETYYQKVYVKDGTLCVGCYPSNFWVNIDTVERYKLESIL